MHEIVTLQLGQRSNYLATHFWNTQVGIPRPLSFRTQSTWPRGNFSHQESYFTYSEDDESPVDHDIHFRPGLGANGSETFTPRTVIYDLKGGFGSLKKINALYDIDNTEQMPKGLWYVRILSIHLKSLPLSYKSLTSRDGSQVQGWKCCITSAAGYRTE